MEISSDIKEQELRLNQDLELKHADLFKDRITAASHIKPIVPIVVIGGSNFASQGDLSIVGRLAFFVFKTTHLNFSAKMENLIKYQYRNQEVEFSLPDKNVMVNATEMANIYKKKVTHFLENENTKAFISAWTASPAHLCSR